MNTMWGNQSKSYLEQIARQGNNSPVAIGYQKLSVTGTSGGLTIPTNATYAFIAFESSNTTSVAVRYKVDGGTPTSTDGMPLLNLDRLEITNAENLSKFKVIYTAAGTHTLHITYYK